MHSLYDAQRVTTKASPTDLVTATDHAAEGLIVGRLAAARPEDGVLSEEGHDTVGTSGVRWVCDPLDGTANFVRRRHPFVVSLAAMISGRVQAAVVYDPWLDEIYDAVSGVGARLNGVRLHCTTQTSLSAAVIATALGRAPQARRRQGLLLRHVVPRVGDLRRTGAAVYDICSVAANRAEGYFFESLKPWDLYAASLIATEAGAEVTDLHGRPGRPAAPLVVAPPELAAGLRALLLEAGMGRTEPE